MESLVKQQDGYKESFLKKSTSFSPITKLFLDRYKVDADKSMLLLNYSEEEEEENKSKDSSRKTSKILSKSIQI